MELSFIDGYKNFDREDTSCVLKELFASTGIQKVQPLHLID